MCSDSYGHPIFTSMISENRFRFLYWSISLDDHSIRTERWGADRFAAIRKVFELFYQNCSLTLYPIQNRVSFKQMYPSKPTKYGLLFKSVNSARLYSLHWLPYCGKPEVNLETSTNKEHMKTQNIRSKSYVNMQVWKV